MLGLAKMGQPRMTFSPPPMVRGHCEWCNETHLGAGLRSECKTCGSCKGPAHPNPNSDGVAAALGDKCYDCAEGDCHVTIEKKLHKQFGDTHPNKALGAGVICPEGHFHFGKTPKVSHSQLFQEARCNAGVNHPDNEDTDEHLMSHGWARARVGGMRRDVIETHHHDMHPKVKEAVTRFADFHPDMTYDCWGSDHVKKNKHIDAGRGYSAEQARSHWGLAKSRASQLVFKSSAHQCPTCRWGGRLRTFLRQNPAMPVTGGGDVDPRGHSWKAGGCTLLAHALKRHLGPEATMHQVSGYPGGNSEHSFIKYRGHVIDADGAHQSEKYLTRKVRYSDEQFAEPFNAREALGSGHYHWGEDCRMLSHAIGKTVGHPDA